MVKGFEVLRRAGVVLFATLESLAMNGSERFRERYVAAGGSNATLRFSPAANKSRADRGRQLRALEPDLTTTVRG